MTNLNMPVPIRDYFAMKGTDANSAAACFTDDAVVWDNGEDLELRGLDKIGAWLSKTSDQYQLTSEVRSIEERDGEHVVDVVVSGNFPGSPYQFAYRFKLAVDKIKELAIDPVGSLAG